MNHRLMRTGLILAALAVTSMVLSIFTMSSILTQHKVTHTVVQVKEVILLSDKQRINLLIDELLTPRSAKCFRAILVHESHMNAKAKNPTSSAKGIGQLLDSTYRNLGMKHSNDGMAQTVAALAYISRHYGGRDATCTAWRHWKIHKSY